MLDIVVGEKRNPLAAEQLIEQLSEVKAQGTLYIGYPVLAALDEPVVVDALLTTLEHGVVVFDLSGELGDKEALSARQDELFNAVRQKLSANRELLKGRELAVPILTISADPAASGLTKDGSTVIAPSSQLVAALNELGKTISEQTLLQVNASIQRVRTIKPARRRNQVTRSDSRGAIMREIELEIANLDSWQKAAAIESPDGPQRIRGLAGSGKTIVLALKAAYLHSRNPEWRIAVTFHTRSLYQQFRDLIRRFTFEQTNDEPDWSKLQVLHSWGSAKQIGVYSEIATATGKPLRNFVSAKRDFGYAQAFEGSCEELLQALRTSPPPPLYDAILIDEAQDLPRQFFELAYLMTKDPHRVVFAYDELQNLTDREMVAPEKLFGSGSDGQPRVRDLTNDRGRPKQDIVLPVCYRNTPWALTTAHALGFGIYREGNLVQFFDQPTLWKEIGYQTVSGAIAPKRHVVLKRSEDATPKFFNRLIEPRDSVVCKVFPDAATQAKWVAEEIRKNLTTDELQAQDILVIVADPITARSEAAQIIKALAERAIASHLAGVTSSVDELFSENSIAITGIYRAKGNEAAMVYLLNSEFGVPSIELIKRRNILFTAITRSRAWVRICGVGEEMKKLKHEVDTVAKQEYQLDFTLPAASELERLRRVHSELAPGTKERVDRVSADLAELIESMERGDLPADAIPPKLLRRIQDIRDKS